MSDFALPVTCYAQSGDLNIAYQTMGNGPVDIILIPGFISHVEFMHEMIGYTRFLRRLSSFARVVTFDKRGQGLSDRADGVAPLEQRMDDVRAIMDEIGSQRAILFGFSEGCPMSILFAATYPERVSRIILFGGFARFADYAGDIEERIRQRVKHWGAGAGINALMPSLAANPDAVALFAKFERLSASPGAVRAVMQMNALIDVRSILPSVRLATLVLHRQNDALVPVAQGLSGMVTWKRCSATSRSSRLARARVPPTNSNAFWRRFCSRISSILRGAPPKWVTVRGSVCWTATINWPNRWSRSIGDP
jgi:pimeloyl-ACP methyl ester carboxylesterase